MKGSFGAIVLIVIGAVSYTHLDVYKRQAQIAIMIISFRSYRCAGPLR